MKKISTFFHSVILLLLLSGTAKAQSTCQANFIFNTWANGAASFTSTSANTNSVTQYYWNFGNNTTYTAMGINGQATATTYTANGTYTVSLFIISVPSCSSFVQYTVNITTASNTVCSLNANFSSSAGPNGLYNFYDLSTNTITGVSYSWNFGDGSPLSSMMPASHTYTANGNYVVTLVATNNATCTSTKTISLLVNTICNLQASFTSTMGNNGLVNFSSTSTGTIAASQYYWQFGDGGTQYGGPTASHTYSNGGYLAVLTVYNNSITCLDTTSNPITITNATCNIAAAFIPSVGTGGQVFFVNTSTGTNANTTYTWNFGNGYFSNTSNPITTYPSSGIYMVSLAASNGGNCSSNYVFTVNVTGIPCAANANFTLAPTNTPQFWIAVPSFPWNISNAVWNWGDNTASSYSLYTAHQYSAAGLYNVCLTVTATCGATATACSSYSVYRASAAASIININVDQPTLKNQDLSNNVGLNNLSKAAALSIYPNPSTGLFNINVSNLESDKSIITVVNLVGDVLYSNEIDSKGGQLTTDISISNAANGVYFVQINSGSKIVTQKLVINK